MESTDEYDVSEPSLSPPLESVTNPSSPLRLPVSSLHLTPCDPDDFLDLQANGAGRFELIDGTLVEKEMASGSHDNTINYLLHSHRNRIERDASNGKKVSKHSAHTDSTVRINKNTILRPDIAIGRSSVKEKEVSFPPDQPPLLVAEVTSNNRDNDLVKKRGEYAAAKIPDYVIIDKDLPHHGQSNRAPTVRVGKLRNGSYEFTHYGPHEMVHFPYIGDLPVNDVLDPPSPSNVIQENVDFNQARVDRETKRAATEAKRAATEAKRAATEAKRADKLQRKKEKKDRKNKEIREFAKQSGVPFPSHLLDSSSSSSNSNTPERPTQRTSSSSTHGRHGG